MVRSEVCERLSELDCRFAPLVDRAEAMDLGTTSADPIEASEATVAKALKGIARIKLNSARIKLHRYVAFHDVPIFTTKYCDLVPSKTNKDQNRPTQLLSGCCSTAGSTLPTPGPSKASRSSSSSSVLSSTTDLSSAASSSTDVVEQFPFSTYDSAKVCLKSALRIAQSFCGLPHPNPYGAWTGIPGAHSSSTSLAPGSTIQAPRTMPSFACCAMQGSYAMLMLCHKAQAINHEDGSSIGLLDAQRDVHTTKFLMEMRDGIDLVLGALDNYSLAFEALDGMREQINAAKLAALATVVKC